MSRAPASPPRLRRSAPIDVEEATIAALSARLASGELSSVALTQAYLDRIDAIDRRGPQLRSVIETNKDALAIAAASDAERKSGRVRGPLHGIPILVKDNLATADRMETTAGSLALVGAKAPRDSHVVAKLREAGAVLLGKTNLTEWANYRSTRAVSGWSGRGGLSRNPYVLDRNTSGSSSGTGASISANLAAAGIGTETDGSIVSPCSCCGLAGIKPTVGLVSRAGIVPISATQDTAGPMARTIADVAALLGAIAGTDPRDPATVRADENRAPDYTKFLDAGGLKGARIGIVRRGLFGYSPATDRIAEAAMAVMKDLGAVLVDPVEIATLPQLDGPEVTILDYEFKAGLAAYFAEYATGCGIRTIDDVIAFNVKNAAKEMPYFGQEIMMRSAKKGPLTEPAYLTAKADAKRLAGAEGIDATMTEHRLDALFAPTNGPAWVIDFLNGDHYLGSSSTPAAVAGYPHVTVPAGFVSGLPIGVSFFGRAWSEPVLIRLAYAYEHASKARKPPTYKPTVN